MEEFNELEKKYFPLGEKLTKKYNHSLVKRREYFKERCIGGPNFVSTLYLVLEKTSDERIIRKVYDFLETIVDFQNAGSISWEIRRYIRKAPPDLIERFIDVSNKIAKVKNEFSIDMDFYWWDTNGGNCKESCYSKEYISQRSLKVVEGLEKRLEQANLHE
ncbi:MAG: hypothetical protein AABX88_02730 [Nanoarchaeota archaeon]